MDQNSANQPGQLIVPHDSEEPDAPKLGSPQPDRPTEQPEPMPEPPSPQPEAVKIAETTPEQPVDEPQPEAGWQFRSEVDPAAPPADALQAGEELTWTASEFIAHEKSAGWYGLLAVGAALVAAGAFIITSHDMISTGAVVLVAITFGMFAARQPKVRQYVLSDVGLHIGDKTYGYQDFKSFSVAEEGAITSIVFMPLKRFMPSLTIYLSPDLEDKVVDTLAARLPMEQHRQDAVDGFLKRIRF